MEWDGLEQSRTGRLDCMKVDRAGGEARRGISMRRAGAIWDRNKIWIKAVMYVGHLTSAPQDSRNLLTLAHCDSVSYLVFKTQMMQKVTSAKNCQKKSQITQVVVGQLHNYQSVK